MYRTLSILFLSISFSFGQDYFIVNDGVKTEDYQYNVVPESQLTYRIQDLVQSR